MFWRCDPNTGAPSKSSKMQYCDERCRCVPDCSDLVYIGVDSQCIGAAIGAGIGGISGREADGEGGEEEIRAGVVEEIEGVDADEVVKVRDTDDDDTTELKTINNNTATSANTTATISTPDTLQPASDTTSHGVFKSFRLECGNSFLNDMCPKAPESYACDETTGKPTYQRKLLICQKNCRCVNACLDITPAIQAPNACLGAIGIGSGGGFVREKVRMRSRTLRMRSEKLGDTTRG